MKNEEISFKDLTKAQLDALKDLYIDSRVDSMSEVDLKKFAKEVLDLQVRGTVGNEEEREVWQEMKDHFGEKFEKTIKQLFEMKGVGDNAVSDPEQEDLQKRLEVLEQRKQEKSSATEDMW